MEKLITSIAFFNKAKFSLGSFVLSIALLSVVSLLSSCGGLVLDAATKSMVTGGTYGEMAEKLPPPSARRGRVYIYRTETSTKMSLQYGVGLIKHPTFCTVDDFAYELIWEAFRYFDLREGNHEITCGDDILKKSEFWSGKNHFQRGKNKVQVFVPSGSEIFVRVDSVKEKPFFQPVVVRAEEGRLEMLKLPYQKGQYSRSVGRISSSESN